MLVPRANAPNGPSPDFASGPVIPNDLFPLTVTIDVFRNGVLFEDQGVLAIPSLSTIGVATDINGNTVDFTGLNWSHLPVLGWTDLTFGPPGTDPVGDYTIVGSLRDAGGNGWDFSLPFRVDAVPEPSAVALAGLGGLGLLAYGWRRRRRPS
jgi:hypothetical protein